MTILNHHSYIKNTSKRLEYQIVNGTHEQYSIFLEEHVPRPPSPQKAHVLYSKFDSHTEVQHTRMLNFEFWLHFLKVWIHPWMKQLL